MQPDNPMELFNEPRGSNPWHNMQQQAHQTTQTRKLTAMCRTLLSTACRKVWRSIPKVATTPPPQKDMRRKAPCGHSSLSLSLPPWQGSEVASDVTHLSCKPASRPRQLMYTANTAVLQDACNEEWQHPCPSSARHAPTHSQPPPRQQTTTVTKSNAEEERERTSAAEVVP